MKIHFRKVCIIGIGLIGGSISLALKKYKIADEVVGVFRRRESLKFALRKKIVDKGYLNLPQAVENTELLILATPVDEIIRMGKEVKDFLPSNTIVTDVGSTKFKIVKELSRIHPNYIGSHPLAGSEKKGAKFSSSKLFLGKMTILTPLKGCDRNLINLMRNFWENLGSKVELMDPRIHDKLLSRISHLPHLLMYALMNLMKEEDLLYVSSGFKDATRIAASNPEIWSEIFFSNRKNILRDLDLIIKKLQKYKKVIKEGKNYLLLKLLAEASQKRRILDEG